MDTLGISLGAFTDEMHRQQASDRADTQDKRQAEHFEWQRQDQMRRQAQAEQFERIKGDYSAFEKAIQDLTSPDAHPTLNRLGKPFGHNFSVVNGKIIDVQPDPKTGTTVAHPVDVNNLRRLAWDTFASQASQLAPEAAARYAQQQSAQHYQEGRDRTRDSQWQQTFDRSDEQFNTRMGLEERRLTSSEQQANARLGLERQRLANDSARVAAYQSSQDRNEAKITPEEEAALIDLQTRFTQSNDPAVRAKLAQDFQLLQNTIAIRNRRFGSLGQLTKPQADNTDPLVEVERVTPDGGTMKMKIPLSQADPVAFADMQVRRGVGGLSAIPPKGAARNEGLPVSAPPAAEDFGFAPSAFPVVLEAAAKGSPQHARQLMYWLQSNELQLGQRQAVEQVLGIR